ncbi:MAG: hypothetical protein O3B76_11640 [Proteobacteria bacterium]|nr:hypothetical protein [Pseudomonadota bacterium]MDA1023458.1 hypothetical protein [Pseudomonadota bacterium]
MRFYTDFDEQNGHWLVLDAANDKRVVGDHISATLAALDAMKREDDSLIEQEVENRRE